MKRMSVKYTRIMSPPRLQNENTQAMFQKYDIAKNSRSWILEPIRDLRFS